jgi:hypothetical protein
MPPPASHRRPRLNEFFCGAGVVPAFRGRGRALVQTSLLGNECKRGAESPNRPANASIEENQHGSTRIPGSASRFALFPATRSAQKASENHDEERVGRRRSDQSRISFLARTGLSEAGHEVRICLLAEATALMRKAITNATLPVGWSPLSERSKNWSPDTCRFLLEAPAPGPLGSRKPI